MNCSSISANPSGAARLPLADNRSNISRGLDNRERRNAHASASDRSRMFAKPRPQGREESALEELFRASRPRFVGLAYTILRNKEDAEDAVQNAFLSAYRHSHDFKGRSAFKTWFTRIVLNAALMIRRTRKTSRMDFLPESSTTDDTPWTETVPASRPDPEMAYAEQETFQQLDILLGKMTPVLRQAFTMTYYDEMSGREASAVLGITSTTFKSRLFRARQHLMNQTLRSVVAPIRQPTHSPFFVGNKALQSFTRSAEISRSEMALS